MMQFFALELHYDAAKSQSKFYHHYNTVGKLYIMFEKDKDKNKINIITFAKTSK